MKRVLFMLLCLCSLSAMAADGETTVGRIEKQGDYYVLNNGATVTQMDKDAYLRFIENNCPEAWNSYRKGTKMQIAGGCLLGIGAVALGGGIAMICVGANNLDSDASTEKNNENTLRMAGGWFIAGIGAAMDIASVPLLVVGTVKRNNSHEVYNESCNSTKATMSLNLQASTDGIGLAFKF